MNFDKNAEIKLLKDANKGWIELCSRIYKKYCDGLLKIEMLEEECKALREQVK